MDCIIFEGKEYSNDFLRNAIALYNKFILETNIPSLNKDCWREIMLRSKSNTIRNLCIVNKMCYDIYMSMEFWALLFKYNEIPPLLIYKNYKINGKSINVPTTMKRLPLINKYVLAFDKMYSYYMIAQKLVHHMTLTKKITYLNPDIKNLSKSLWLPEKMIAHIYNIKDVVNDTDDLYLKLIKNKFYLKFDNGVKENRVKIHVNKYEFINYLTWMFYYESDYEYFDIDTDKGSLNIDDLFRGTKRIKKIFPTW